MTFYVKINLEGSEQIVGTLSGDAPEQIAFSYSPKYLEEVHRPISLSLPLQEEAFSPEATRTYFEGLLPEGFTRKSVAKWMHVDTQDYISILSGLGKECLGALRIAEHEKEETESDYEPLSMDQVRKLASEGAETSAELVVKAHLSLTGASGKVGLYYAPDEERWYLPKGSAPSTHIVKQSHVRLQEIVTNEQLTQTAAGRLGIKIPKSFIINTGSGADHEILLATERYDRLLPKKAADIRGLAMPERLHQEDFAQILGIRSLDKYEKPGNHYLQQLFRVIRQYSSNPMEDQLQLWDRIIFNFLTGNTDAHVKNYSILYSPNLERMRLAPAYDLVSTAVYEGTNRDMAMAVGGVYDLSKIKRSHFEEAAEEVRLGRNIAMKHFDRMAKQFEHALDESAAVLRENGFTQAESIRDRILASGGYRNLV
ncbi:MAG: type II toxin-antitoxin system HipA family toxin [Lachnospiraceae bacterium]|nr:type II toxin-antitoxin system HipA family toxin [Lachnospiraceae bacterium]